MAKPIPNNIEYIVADGTISLQGDYLCLAYTAEEQARLPIGEENREQAAGVLLALAKVLLDQIGDPEVSNRSLFEAGLLEAIPLRDASYDLKGLRVEGLKVNENPKRTAVTDTNESGQEGNIKTKSLLLPQVIQDLLTGGIDPDAVRYFGSLNGYAKALNNNQRGLLKAAATMMAKPGFNARLVAFVKKNPAPANGVELPEFSDKGGSAPPDDNPEFADIQRRKREAGIPMCKCGRDFVLPDDTLCSACVMEEAEAQPLKSKAYQIEEDDELCPNCHQPLDKNGECNRAFCVED